MAAGDGSESAYQRIRSGQYQAVTVAERIGARLREPLQLDGVTTVVLQFPKFTDGRAFSQAFLLRRRLGFTGEIRATGDVLIDQLVQMQRTGFSSAVLREGVDPADAQRQFEMFPGFYQGDAVNPQPLFASKAA